MNPFPSAKAAIRFYFSMIGVYNDNAAISYERNPAAPLRIDFSNEVLETCTDIKRIYDDCEMFQLLWRWYVCEESKWAFSKPDWQLLKKIRREFIHRLIDGEIVVEK
jgi:hypothetical protein